VNTPTTTRSFAQPVATPARMPVLPLYFALTLGLSWLLGGLAALVARRDITLPLPPLALVALGGIWPLPVALGLTAYESGRAGVRGLLVRTVHWRVGSGWYAAALLGPVLVVLAAYLLSLAVNRAMGVASPALPPGSAWAALPVLGAVYLVLAVIEEVGWRGFAQPRLQNRFRALPASLVLGGIWACWHVPQWFVPATGQAVKWPFPVFVGYALALSVLFAWLVNGTRGSVLVVILAHAAINLAPEPWAAAWQVLPVEARGVYPAILVGVVLAIAALVVALLTDPRTLTRRGQRR
jgi:CAAX protease family protein